MNQKKLSQGQSKAFRIWGDLDNIPTLCCVNKQKMMRSEPWKLEQIK